MISALPPTAGSWVYLIGAALTGGGLKLVLDLVKAWRTGPPKALRAVSIADANIASVARARDELIEDNIRLRAERIEQDARHEAERRRWVADQERLRGDIARLERKICEERDQAARRYDGLLRQVHHLGIRTVQVQLEDDSNG